jgi:hypothetical protein
MMSSIADADATASASPKQVTWEDMLAAFRALGGVAENLRIGRSPQGQGLYAADPAMPVLMRIPGSLIFPIEEVAFTDGRIGINDASTAGRAEREFFHVYANSFSWGGGGRREAETYLAGLDALPVEVRQVLIAGFGMGEFLEGEREERIRRWFLRSRLKTWNGRSVLIPIMELAGRDAEGLTFRADAGGNLQIEGRVRDEILVNHGPIDAFGFFRSTGLARRQPQAFSLPLQLNIEDRKLRIDRNLSARVVRGSVHAPMVQGARDELVFSYLMIGSLNNPRLSRPIFTALAQESGISDVNDAFDKILYFNRLRFLELLAALEPYEGGMIAALRRMARHQLEAMAFCIGTRDL